MKLAVRGMRTCRRQHTCRYPARASCLSPIRLRTCGVGHRAEFIKLAVSEVSLRAVVKRHGAVPVLKADRKCAFIPEGCNAGRSSSKWLFSWDAHLSPLAYAKVPSPCILPFFHAPSYLKKELQINYSLGGGLGGGGGRTCRRWPTSWCGSYPRRV